MTLRTFRSVKKFTDRIEEQRRKEKSDEQREDPPGDGGMPEPRDGAGGEEPCDAAQTAVETITPQAGIGHSREAATATMPSAGATQQRSAITRSTCHARLNRQRASAVANTSVAPHNAARWHARMPPSSVSLSALHGCREKCRRSTDASSRTARRTRSKSGDQGRDDRFRRGAARARTAADGPAALAGGHAIRSGAWRSGMPAVRPTPPRSRQTAATRRAFRIDRAARAASQDRSPPPPRGATGSPGGSRSDTSWRPGRQRGCRAMVR